MTRYVALDIESTGLDPVTGQVLELALVVETDWTTPVADLPKLHLRVEHETITGSPRALVMNAGLIAALAKSGRRPQTTTVMDWPLGKYAPPGVIPLLVRQFLNKHFEPGVKVTAAGKNVGTFDLRFLERLEGWPAERFRSRVIDVGNLWWEPSGDEWLPDTDTCLSRAGVVNDRPHEALHDCYATISMVRRRFAPKATDRPPPKNSGNGA